MTIKRKKGYFSISAVAEMFSIHQQTIRMYEKEGLINPKRSEGNTRMFSEEDIERLEEVIRLTHELGINLAGVQMILKLQKQIKKMQDEMNAVFNKAQSDLSHEATTSKKQVAASARRLMAIKKNTVPTAPLLETAEKPKDSKNSEEEGGEWQIDYEE
jgi:MerR family transcriptional regulator/heat shock protein HspR